MFRPKLKYFAQIMQSQQKLEKALIFEKKSKASEKEDNQR